MANDDALSAVGTGNSRGDPAGSLDDVDEVETISDCIDPVSLSTELPRGWVATADILCFDRSSLEEVVRFKRSWDDPQLVLKPVELTEPNGPIELYERADPRGDRTLAHTVETVSEARRAAVNWCHQRS